MNAMLASVSSGLDLSAVTATSETSLPVVDVAPTPEPLVLAATDSEGAIKVTSPKYHAQARNMAIVAQPDFSTIEAGDKPFEDTVFKRDDGYLWREAKEGSAD